MNADQALQKLVSIMRRCHYSYSTEQNYSSWVRRYIGFLKTDKHGQTSEEKFQRFLSHLAREGVAASTQNQAFNAIIFFYKHVVEKPLGEVKALRAQGGHHERTAPTRSQMKAILSTVQDVHGYPIRLICFLLYGCGLRVSEPLNLRIKDVVIEEMKLIIRQAKHHKDRVVALPPALVPAIQKQMQIARTFYEYDREKGIPVTLPGLLAKKYKRAPFSWQWYWLFPSAKPCVFARDGQTYRYRVHEANVQKAVRTAARNLEIEGVVTPHNFRHAYATHLLDSGVKIKAVAQAMGHESIETTAGYDHSEPLSVPSPLELGRRQPPAPIILTSAVPLLAA
jgi:integron integrase